TKAAVAPTGKLRVAFLLVPLYAAKDPATGDLRGIAPDLGRQLAQRLGVPFEPSSTPTLPPLLGGTKSGQWDVALFGISAERAADMDFSAPLMEVEQGYLVRAGVPITTASEVDRAGVRVVVLEKGGADVILSQTLKSATIIRVKTQPESAALLDTGTAEVYAATKTALRGVSAPGQARTREGRLGSISCGMAVPNGAQSRRRGVRRQGALRTRRGGAGQDASAHRARQAGGAAPRRCPLRWSDWRGRRRPREPGARQARTWGAPGTGGHRRARQWNPPES
ncbi:MAG: transporter substrate-binding domain-containing protein, partial [Betaproteobacteria bacterium]|nr:transporter substrate-binding domain-containing protein [Betaproteobacteria bacterium]